jgi:translation initiation factor 1A
MYLVVAVGILRERVRSLYVRLLFLLIVLTDRSLARAIVISGFGYEKLGKRKVINEEELETMVLPVANDVLGMAVRMLGFDRIMVRCQDGKERLCRVRGKLKRRVWIRVGDIVLVSPWDFQSDKRGDIFWRYRKNQIEWLRSHGHLTM